jgi:protein ImuA
MDRAQVLTDLRYRIRALEVGTVAHQDGMWLGIPALDHALPENGLPLACIHEVYGEADDNTAARGFLATLLARLPPGPVIWIGIVPDLYMPGLQPFGIGPADLVHVEVRCSRDGLWAMEEALRWPGLRAVVAELDSFDLTATRRLQLAAECSGVTGFLLSWKLQGLTSGVTRWHIRPAPGEAWQIDLLRCKGGNTASAIWRHG